MKFVRSVNFLCFFLCFTNAKNQDSYISALKKSHDVDTLSDQNDFSGPFSENTGIPSSSGLEYYGSSKSAYGPPGYELPKPIYGPPPTGYDAPKPIYGPPISGPSYPLYGHTTSIQFNPYSHPAESWMEKLKLKFDLFTIGKLLLKLILFKKVVKFLAVLCLLLFLPKLQDKSDANQSTIMADEEDRHFSEKYGIDTRINEITTFATSALKEFARKNPEACPDIPCRFMKMVDTVDEQYPLNKIINMYVPSQ